MKNSGRAYFKAIVLSWRTYVLLPYLILILPLAILHGLLVLIQGYIELINEAFVWLGTYTSRPAKWWREKSSRIAEIDAIRLAEFEAEFKSRRRRSRVRDVFGNTHNV